MAGRSAIERLWHPWGLCSGVADPIQPPQKLLQDSFNILKDFGACASGVADPATPDAFTGFL